MMQDKQLRRTAGAERFISKMRKLGRAPNQPSHEEFAEQMRRGIQRMIVVKRNRYSK